MVFTVRYILGTILLVLLSCTVIIATDPQVTTESPPPKTEPTPTDNERVDNGRSLGFDISKYTSSEFHNKNNVYTLPTSPENEKFITHDETIEEETSSYNIDLTPPSTEFFDKRHRQIEESVKQTLDEIVDVGKHEEQVHAPDLKELLDRVKENSTETHLDVIKVTKSSHPSSKTSEEEKLLKINFTSTYNDTKTTNDTYEPITRLDNKIKIGDVRERITSYATSPTKEVTKRGSLKFSTTTTPSSSTQLQQENNVYPILVPLPTTTASTMSEPTTTHFYEITEEVATTSRPLTTERAEKSTIEANVVGTTPIGSKETFYEMTEQVVVDTTTTQQPTTMDESTTTAPSTDHSLQETNENVTTTLEDLTTIFTTDSTTLSDITDKEAAMSDVTDKEAAMSTVAYETTSVDSLTTTTNSESAIATEITTQSVESNTIIKQAASITAVINKTNAIVKNVTKQFSELDLDNDDEDDDYVEVKKSNSSLIDESELNVVELTSTSTTTQLPVTLQHDKMFDNDLTITSTTSTTMRTTTMKEEMESEVPEMANPMGNGDDDGNNSGTIIAIVISTVGAICLILLAILLVIMRRRQKRFTYGQRCTPVSLDAYSMDNVSVYNNSVRRKGALRGSKRSYGNPAFDDSSVSHLLDFQSLVKFARNMEDIKSEFDEIPQVTARMSELPDGCDTKNRYANVIPLPETRVCLTPIPDDPTGDYINANYVTGSKGVRGYYIACQAPLQNTVNDFWRMIWEQQSKVILMLTHLYENGIEKCIDYLPPSEVIDCHRLFGDYQITLKKREVKEKYIISSLQLKNMVTNSWREVTHLWYSGWPEKGVPNEENSLIAFLIEARSYIKPIHNTIDRKNKENLMSNGNSSDVSPVVVHCSPGTGRTGTVIACDIAIREFELTRTIDIPKIVYKIRRDRASSVQTKDQYTFIYKVINMYATKLTGGALEPI